MQELENKSNNEKISLDEYKKRLNTSNDTYEKEIQKLKEELKKSKEYINRDKKDKNEVLKKFSELTEESQKYIKENQKYIKEKQIIEQELNKKEQELNKQEQELASNNKTIDNLNIEIKLLKDSDKLRKIKGSKDSSMPTKIPQSVRKRDDKARTFASEDFKKDSLPEYNKKSNRSENLEN